MVPVSSKVWKPLPYTSQIVLLRWKSRDSRLDRHKYQSTGFHLRFSFWPAPTVLFREFSYVVENSHTLIDVFIPIFLVPVFIFCFSLILALVISSQLDLTISSYIYSRVLKKVKQCSLLFQWQLSCWPSKDYFSSHFWICIVWKVT